MPLSKNLKTSPDSNIPLAYQTGYQNFYERDFLVTPDVLIPRPESEMLVDSILNLCGKSYLPGVKPSTPQISDDLSILDVGTGSGCLAVTLKLELPQAHVFASDISTSALGVAQENARRFHAEIVFIHSDLLENIDFAPDLIVANLPYVDASWSWLDHTALSAEPAMALYAENHGLALIYRLIEQLPEGTKYLVLEADPSEHVDIIKYAKKHNLSLFETRGFGLVLCSRILKK